MVFCGLKLFLTLIGVSVSFNDKEFLQKNFEQVYNGLNRGALLALTIIQIILDFGFWSFLVELLVFHIFLMFKGKSTYDFIIERRKKRMNKLKKTKKKSLLEEAVFPPKIDALNTSSGERIQSSFFLFQIDKKLYYL